MVLFRGATIEVVAIIGGMKEIVSDFERDGDFIGTARFLDFLERSDEA